MYSKCIYKANHERAGDSSYQQHTLCVGDIVEVLVDNTIDSEVVVTPSQEGHGTKQFFFFCGLAGVDNEPWSSVIELEEENTFIHKVSSFLPSKMMILPLKCNVRKSGSIHTCEKTSELRQFDLSPIDFKDSTESGDIRYFQVIPRSEGYLPSRS